jgi:hypothetical protein
MFHVNRDGGNLVVLWEDPKLSSEFKPQSNLCANSSAHRLMLSFLPKTKFWECENPPLPKWFWLPFRNEYMHSFKWTEAIIINTGHIFSIILVTGLYHV